MFDSYEATPPRGLLGPARVLSGREVLDHLSNT